MKKFWVMLALGCLPLLGQADELDIYRGEPVPVPARVMLLIDTSGSMGRDLCTGEYEEDEPFPSADACGSRMSVLKQTLARFVDENDADANNAVRWPDDFEIGLARYSGDRFSQEYTSTAIILLPVRRLGSVENGVSHRQQLANAIQALDPNGGTPLVSSYLEAVEFLKGGNAISSHSVNRSHSSVWNGASANGDYNPGISSELICGTNNNHVVVLTDGLSTDDNMGESIYGSTTVTRADRIKQIVTGDDQAQASNTDACNENVVTDNDDSDNPQNDTWICANQLASSLVDVDPSNADSIRGVRTHTIAYSLGSGMCGETLFANPETAPQYLCNWALAGGGKGYAANDQAGLEAAFSSLTSDVQLTESFTAAVPGVGVNQANRFTFLDDIYFSVFKPSDRQFWYGNLKKYKLDIANNAPFVKGENNRNVDSDRDGFFDQDARSFWFNSGDYPNATVSQDGDNVILGGAALGIPAKDSRYLYTHLSGSTERIDAAYAATVATAMLPTTFENADVEADLRTRVAGAIDWLRGDDALDADDALVTKNEWQRLTGHDQKIERTLYGAPIHSSPVLVNYTSSRDVSGVRTLLPVAQQDNLVFVSTNDGKLYGVNSLTGEEKLAFVPGELLARASDAEPSFVEVVYEAARGNSVGSPLYGLDSTWSVWRQDVNRDGNITSSGSNDFVYLYGGMRRGGRNYYGLDVTAANNNSPSLEQLFVLQGGLAGTPFANMGQTWSEPVLGLIKYNGEAVVVMIVAGGYDPVYDTGVPANGTVPQGAQIYFVAAHDRTGGANNISAGDVLWWGSAALTGVGNHHTISSLTESIPSTVKTLDRNGDGYVDHVYVADLGGQLFRFDINNETNGGHGGLISNEAGDGVVVARLGRAGNSGVTAADDRRFFFPPSVALMKDNVGKYVAIAIGSGLLTSPRDTVVDERFFFIKDYKAVGGNSAAATAVDSEPLLLESEKMMGSPLIVGGRAFLTTYYWGDNAVSLQDTQMCRAQYGRAALYYYDPESFDVTTNTVSEIAKAYPQTLAGTIATVLQTIPPVVDEDGTIITPGGSDFIGIGGTSAFDLPDIDLGNIRKTRWRQCEDATCATP